MTRIQRIKSFLAGIWFLLAAFILIVDPDDGFSILTTLLSLSLLASGIRYVAYYCTMARCMVGGRNVLFLGILLLDISFFTTTLADEPRMMIIIYLVICRITSGIVNILQVIQEKMYHAGSWRRNLVHAVISFVTAAACLVFMNNPVVPAWIYAAGLIYTAGTRIASAFRKTEIVYVA